MRNPTDTWVVVFEARRERQCTETGLVLVAVGIEHEVAYFDDRWQLRVPAASAARAAEELALYRQENRRPTGGASPLEELESGWQGVFSYAAALLVFAVLDGRGAFGRDWLAAGGLEAGRVVAGEWWRAVTALTLHVDLGHLAANLGFGGFFGLYVGRYLGAGIGWAFILAGGVAGNLLNAMIQPAPHRAIGASTAVFAALGLLAAYTWRKGFLAHTPWKTRIAPVIAGIALLAFTGSGAGSESGTVDIMAHLTGFVCGFVLGVLAAVVSLPRHAGAQRFAAALAAGGLLLAWVLALGSAGGS